MHQFIPESLHGCLPRVRHFRSGMIQHICKNIYHVSINPRVFHVESSEQFLVGELGIGLMLLPAADSVIGKSTKSFKTGVPQINMLLRQNSGASSSFQRSRSLRPNFRVYTLNQGSCTSSRDINILSLHMNDDLHSAIETPSFFQAF